MNWRRSRVNAQSQSKIQSKFQVAGATPEVVQLLQKSHSCNWTQLQAPFLARSNNPILFFENIRSLMLKEITDLALSSIGNCAKRHVAAKRQLTVLSSPRQNKRTHHCERVTSGRTKNVLGISNFSHNPLPCLTANTAELEAHASGAHLLLLCTLHNVQHLISRVISIRSEGY